MPRLTRIPDAVADVLLARLRRGVKADRYWTAWLACRRDRRADRAAMAAELPDVLAGQQARAIAPAAQ
ncbi:MULTISPECIES: hypothetical protein [unclassified Streptomyces]|uniref:hypothetical protein n=1 Tax=unclassified Streptomyces TaxID=2593676 RepID=UPI003647737D